MGRHKASFRVRRTYLHRHRTVSMQDAWNGRLRGTRNAKRRQWHVIQMGEPRTKLSARAIQRNESGEQNTHNPGLIRFIYYRTANDFNHRDTYVVLKGYRFRWNHTHTYVVLKGYCFHWLQPTMSLRCRIHVQQAASYDAGPENLAPERNPTNRERIRSGEDAGRVPNSKGSERT